MQMNFDLTDTEIVNLKRKIDKLDPVAQAEKVVEYISKNYTQKQLGEKLGKTRDWVAKRVQFIRALEKLPKSEQEEIKNLVRHNTISMDVVILVADLPKEQRGEILSKHPTVAETRRLIYEYRPRESSEAKLKVLERQLSKAYIECEKMVSDELISFRMTRNYCGNSIPSSLDKKIVNFLKVNWVENYRYGLEVHINTGRMDKQILSQRIAWLELPEKERIKTLQETVKDRQQLYRDMIKELESQARQVPSLMDMVKALRFQLALFKMGDYQNVEGVSLNFGNGIPPLVLNIADDQVNRLYKALAREFHPDHHQDDKPQYEEIMKSINVWNDRVSKLHKEAH